MKFEMEIDEKDINEKVSHLVNEKISRSIIDSVNGWEFKTITDKKIAKILSDAIDGIILDRFVENKQALVDLVDKSVDAIIKSKVKKAMNNA